METPPQSVPVSHTNAGHYTWTGATAAPPCDGWHLHRSPGLSVIEEWMPPGAAEHRHLHRHATQFFYVLDGRLDIEVAGATHLLEAGTGITIAPETAHQVFNRTTSGVRFLVISQPPSHDDRVLA